MGSDITVEILKEIRDEIRGTNQRLDGVEVTMNQRLGAVETTLRDVATTMLDLAEQQRSSSATRRLSPSAIPDWSPA